MFTSVTIKIQISIGFLNLNFAYLERTHNIKKFTPVFSNIHIRFKT